jgi:hypothetical protein
MTAVLRAWGLALSGRNPCKPSPTLLGGRLFLLSQIGQLDQGHRCRITRPETDFQNSQVAARTFTKSWAEIVEQFANR